MVFFLHFKSSRDVSTQITGIFTLLISARYYNDTCTHLDFYYEEESSNLIFIFHLVNTKTKQRQNKNSSYTHSALSMFFFRQLVLSRSRFRLQKPMV